MAGENNATTIIFQKGATPADIVGQGEFTATFGGTPIDISNKSFGDFVTLLDGEMSGKQLVVSGTLIYNSDTVYRAVRADALTCCARRLYINLSRWSELYRKVCSS